MALVVNMVLVPWWYSGIDDTFMIFILHFKAVIYHTRYSAPEKHIMLTCPRRDVPVGVPLDLSTPTGMSCIGTYGENCKSDNVSKYRVLLVALYYYGMKIDVIEKYSKFIIYYLFYFLFSEN